MHLLLFSNFELLESVESKIGKIFKVENAKLTTFFKITRMRNTGKTWSELAWSTKLSVCAGYAVLEAVNIF